MVIAFLGVCALPVDSFGADPAPSASDSGIQVIKGIVLILTDQMVVIKPDEGAGVLVQFDKDSTRDRPIKEGELVEVRLSADGTVQSVTHVAP